MKTIKKRREMRGMTQASMAAALGVSQPTVVYWESVGGYPSGKDLPRIARLLGCTIDELYDEKEGV